MNKNRIYNKLRFSACIFCYAFIVFLNTSLSGYAQEGRYNFLNIGNAHNIEYTYELNNGKLLINPNERGFLEISRDLRTWYGSRSGKRFTPSLKSEVEFFRVRKSNPRPVRTYIPKTYDPNKKYPLVINLHGYTGDWSHQNGYFFIRKESKSKKIMLPLSSNP